MVKVDLLFEEQDSREEDARAEQDDDAATRKDEDVERNVEDFGGNWFQVGHVRLGRELSALLLLAWKYAII